jgi:hypothetical protein
MTPAERFTTQVEYANHMSAVADQILLTDAGQAEQAALLDALEATIAAAEAQQTHNERVAAAVSSREVAVPQQAIDPEAAHMWEGYGGQFAQVLGLHAARFEKIRGKLDAQARSPQ